MNEIQLVYNLFAFSDYLLLLIQSREQLYHLLNRIPFYYFLYSKQMSSTADTNFLLTLWQILSDPHLKRTLSWDIDGSTFTIWSLDNFTQTILTKYFPSMTFVSFRRRLESFGFKITKHQRKALEFYHSLFQRTEKESINLIRRIHQKKKSFVPYRLSNQSPTKELVTSIQQLQNSIQKIRREKECIQSKISKFLTSFYAEVIKLDLKQQEPRLEMSQFTLLLNSILSPIDPLNKDLVQKVVSTVGEIMERESQSATQHPETVVSGDPLSSNQYYD